MKKRTWKIAGNNFEPPAWVKEAVGIPDFQRGFSPLRLRPTGFASFAFELRLVVNLVGVLLSTVMSWGQAKVDLGVEPRLKPYFAAKEQQARELAEVTGEKVTDLPRFFAFAQEGNWAEAQKCFRQLEQLKTSYGRFLDSPTGQPIAEVYMALDLYANGEPAYATWFGDEVIKTIPRGSIYFGGTDSGRGLISALCESQIKGLPFFTLTQNALANDGYVEYLRHTYKTNINLPIQADLQKCFAEYSLEAAQRLRDGKLLPRENVQIKDGKVLVAGEVAVMGINAKVARWIFEKNPNREFYVEESVPLDWMYPHLIPYGFILKLQRQPLADFPEELLANDRDFGAAFCRHALGNPFTNGFSVKSVCESAEGIHGAKKFNGFGGDPGFARNRYTCMMFSKLRAATAGLFFWQANQAKSVAKAASLRAAAKGAAQQAFVLCPYNPEATLRYAQELLGAGGKADALLVVRTANKLGLVSDVVDDVRQQLESMLRHDSKNGSNK